MKYIGHLDVMRYFQKAIRRSGLDVAYTEGFNPHQIMSFAAPLGVGQTSESEYFDIELHTAPSMEELVNRLNEVMTDFLAIEVCEVLHKKDIYLLDDKLLTLTDIDNLKQTINAQPCILATEIAILEALKSELNIEINFAAGHSLGEYAALYCAGVINTETAAKLINARAVAMNKVNSGSMSAIIGLKEELLEEVLKEASEIGYVDAANYNTPEQTVITGEENAVAKANELALAKGAKRAIPLAVSGAFHSKLMEDAAKEFEEFSSKAQISNAQFPVITNVDAQATTNADDFRAKMPAQIYSSVRWVQTLNYLTPLHQRRN